MKLIKITDVLKISKEGVEHNASSESRQGTGHQINGNNGELGSEFILLSAPGWRLFSCS